MSCCCFAAATRARRRPTSRGRKNIGQSTSCGRRDKEMKKGASDEHVDEKLSRFIAGEFARPGGSGGLLGRGARGRRQPGLPSGSARCGGRARLKPRGDGGGSEPGELIPDAFGRR